MQLNLFETALAAALSAALTAPSSALSPIVGLRVRMPRGCQVCGSYVGTIGSSCGSHAARLTCECCIHRGWLGARETAFVIKIVSTFGCPITPIVVREWRHV
jgi:hypothetical protein